MQQQTGRQVSAKSRAILYRFKNSLAERNMLLDTHISNVFQYRKQKFTRKQFHKLILKFDQNLILSDIDAVFEELDQTGKNSIQYTLLSQVINSIDEDDNPAQSLNRKSIIISNPSQRKQTNALIEFKDTLVNNMDYLQTIQLFITEKDGFLTKPNVQALLDNLSIRDQNKVQLIISNLFEEKDKIQLIQFLQKLDLNNDGTRIRLSDYSINQSIILDNDKSNFIKNQRKSRASQQFNIQYSRILQGINQLDINSINSGFYVLQKIPRVLQPYFNYGSELQEPFATLASNFIQNNLIFIDEQGPTYNKAFKWVHIAEVKPIYFLFQAAESVIYRQKDRKGLGMLLEPKDITQGKYGNCYFLSALAAIVECYPQLVYRLFVLEKNPSHIFGVRLFIDGIWKTIAVDGCFPINQKGNFCGAQPHHNQIWVMLLEKAWAKIFKTYESIHSGYNQQGLVAISGAPTIIYLTKQQGYLQKVQQEFKKGSIITCTTAKSVAQISQEEQQMLGVFAGHAYTILKIFNDVQVDNQKIILIKMKNPWGTKAWRGNWSFKSKKWTQKLRQRLNYTIDSNDGTFFICLEDFVKYFDHINISKVNLGNRNSYVTNNANRYDFYYNRFVIVHEGTYFFTLYQDNGRKYKNGSGVYQKSPSWLFLGRIAQKTENNQILALDSIACNASGYQHSTVEAYLPPGEYVILSKVSWNYWQEHPYVITSYGPFKVKFQPALTCPLDLLVQFIISWSTKIMQRNQGTKSYYKNTTIWKCFYFQHSQGLGFVSIGNNQNKIIQSTLTLDPCKGIQILAPFSNPICMRAQPNEVVTCSFLIDPQGYSYKMMESYKLFILKQ